MAIQTFVANTVLTAAQQNALQANDYNQTVSAKVASYTLVAPMSVLELRCQMQPQQRSR